MFREMRGGIQGLPRGFLSGIRKGIMANQKPKKKRKLTKKQLAARKQQRKRIGLVLLLCAAFFCCGFFARSFIQNGRSPVQTISQALEGLSDRLKELLAELPDQLPLGKNQLAEGEPVSLEEIPSFSGEPYVVLEDNIPDFSENELTTEAYETYSPRDFRGRCQVARACIGEELMPTEERGSINEVTPSGWENEKYDFVDGGFVYNRCHLIGFQLTGENANARNLITGTRYLNVEGMLPFENAVAEYIEDTGNHVLYRVTPIYDDYNLVASGVQMEAYSVEDDGEGICFDVYCYNVQPGVEIDYATGENWAE